MYFIAVILFLLGFLSISLGRISSDNVKNINALLSDDRNIQETKGSLQVIEIRSTRHSFECDCELIFINHNGKEFSYKETYSGFNSKASFLWKCENKGKVPITVIYNKRLPSKHFVKELKPLEVNKNSRIGYIIIGILFMLLGIFIIAVNFKLKIK
ncbi:hypothetical protein LDK18_00050 [Fusobacterium nucleatum subsp. nucleatum ATCC 23726]|uniref:DUF3592 domain-containing protein n=3 Tax=Fusobacterium nucleatum subsp. nucleatum TaxID=76856 RepID=Q8RHR1_FUSNN|nr:hypothetical protein [Fusobacterium nucleatum]AAL94037.1 unknown [Fusobacterium nucleatum subsp. nucleatum ATCC 25586]ALF26447.1 hypothetical protein RN95_08525 [Fusobacterium nucleatum subsp. nucleatum]AVQ14556.1 hypothetical protein C7Y58_03165 [Fusobacterium nucleatum subsp. nucleatum ATCC 25586]AVQ22735.1 hypothetical protein C4N14_03370 [Fusobacterium nucleatum subsp. nucleatum ATCC 23726]EFG94631.1 hypothetical protein HMPREF0397_1797 [Fusobacterium nucleatum subsp. nucleatum ATCC 237